ncbi:protein OBERON 1-like [Mangifera indica]|uniref:protein OBERON 1-like n=1 Tax=Mangifera indica TaxID=29780 RepID=UPI001CF9A1DF|nr:protein OBERON 1-like [Mangifera indica]XP_044500790.1 protein OBERON 1-like [Mangifera indica]
MELMGVDNSNESIERVPSVNGSSIDLWPVSPEGTGEGLPYAPINWPKPGDNWRWRVGRRIALTGHYYDRYLYPPKHFRRLSDSTSRRRGFASKLSVQRYIETVFPHEDVNKFFASFSWKIPAIKNLSVNGNVEGETLPAFIEEIAERSCPDSPLEDVGCKARNKMCNSLVVQAEISSLTAMPCDICCNEPRFCRDCCCILCGKTVNLKYGGYSYIKCEAMAGENYICGHIAHLSCALRCYMAGTVGGSFGLDAEYCCRRCDAKTDLVPLVIRLVKICESVDTLVDVEEILNLSVCILRGSERTIAKEWLSRIELAIRKLKCGASLEAIWKVEDTDLAIFTGVSDDENATLELTTNQDPTDVRASPLQTMPTYSDQQMESQKLEEEIDQVLQALKKSQETEYKLAEERLYEQKNYLCNMYQQLDKERSELAHHTSEGDQDMLLNAVLNTVNQIKRQVTVLKDMEKVAKGFGRTSKKILKEHYDLEIED